MTERDYVLGTHDAEVDRLGLQHRVWKGRMLEAWRRAGIRPGLCVADLGCGPGYAALDLSEILGPTGKVVAIERSTRFLAHLRAQCEARSISNVSLLEADIMDAALKIEPVDAVWCRWVLSFVADPDQAVTLVRDSVKPGGVAVFHEYLNYGTWQLMPRSHEFDAMVAAVIESVSQAGGEMNIGLRLPQLLERAGFRIEHAQPIVDIVGPHTFTWHWPMSFVREFAPKLVERALISAEKARKALEQMGTASETGTSMVTPIVLEIIARKL